MARILIIEDEEIFRTMLRQILEERGHTVAEADDGITGIALYRRHPADLIITDIIMPNKDGMAVISELKRDFPDVKIIAITGGGQKGQAEFFFDASLILGAKRTFLKPVHMPELLAAIDELLRD